MQHKKRNAISSIERGKGKGESRNTSSSICSNSICYPSVTSRWGTFNIVSLYRIGRKLV